MREGVLAGLTGGSRSSAEIILLLWRLQCQHNPQEIIPITKGNPLHNKVLCSLGTVGPSVFLMVGAILDLAGRRVIHVTIVAKWAMSRIYVPKLEGN